MKILVTGASGGLARRVITRLHGDGHDVVGIDRRPWPDAPSGVSIYRVDIRKRPAEDVFRSHKPDVVIHMATVTYVTAGREERARINLGGTRSIWKFCESYKVRQAIFIGRHTVYGAAPDFPLYRSEDEPLLAGTTFPNLADLVSADQYAAHTLWQMPKLKTAVLRLVYTLGPSKRGTLASFLKAERIPTVMGFDPLFQFIHEEDAARAIVLAIKKKLKGVFNVSGPEPVPLSVLCEATGRTSVPIPETLYPLVLGKFGFSRLPKASMSHIKYPVVVDSGRFQAATGFEPEFDVSQTMAAFRWQ